MLDALGSRLGRRGGGGFRGGRASAAPAQQQPAQPHASNLLSFVLGCLLTGAAFFSRGGGPRACARSRPRRPAAAPVGAFFGARCRAAAVWGGGCAAAAAAAAAAARRRCARACCVQRWHNVTTIAENVRAVLADEV
jgi:hypothetical protein